MKHCFPLIMSLSLLAACSTRPTANPDSDPIRINQVGYYANQSKTAVIEADGFTDNYRLLDAATRQVVWEGPAARVASSPWSDKQRHIIDFSTVAQPGNYLLEAGPYVKKVVIAQHPLHASVLAATKAFYYQRSGEALESEFAGQWLRPMAHPDTCVLVHASAATKKRPEGTVISSPGGWYDAGDYNKYIVNSGFTLGEMMLIYQLHPNYFNSLNLNIPESANATPDVLDEMMVNLRWMLTMQDSDDGGVYHKLTTPNFEGFVMPDSCRQPRYVVQKGTAASLDFAATMAMASRIYGQFDEYASFAKQAKSAAISAWKWALKHPKTAYDQRTMNEKFAPAINTGEYGDGSFRDEFFWAASELYFTTGKAVYLYHARQNAPKSYTLPTWGQVDGLGLLSWLVQATYGFSPEADRLGNRYSRLVIDYCDELIASMETSCYDSPYGNRPEDFGWGCLAEHCCGQGLSMLFAHRMTSEARYMSAALKCADYLLGRNATGYCYVTGIGQKSPMHPHHRISAADGIDEPIPGLLVGGPNPGRQDGISYPSELPDEAYMDVTESYASNEIAINWNAGLFALLGGLEAVVK